MKVSEGKATLVGSKPEDVFYNPIQQFNRDISVMSIKAWSQLYPKKREEPFINIVEGLAATGLRSCRYAKEIPLVKTVLANDLSAAAVEQIKMNAAHNEVSEVVVAKQGDANDAIRSTRAHIVDLDPYGGAAPFLDAAVQSAVNGGMLLVTCTDLAVLAGNAHPEKCFSQYGGTTLHGDSGHESALRLLLNTVATTAAKYGRAIVPMMSISVDYYIRCFIMIKTSKLLVKENLSKSMIVYYCTGCTSHHTQPLGVITPKYGTARGPVVGTHCEFCGNPFRIAGPMWAGRLHDTEFVNKVLEVCQDSSPETYGTKPRIQGILELVKREIPDSPFYLNPPNLGSIVRSPLTPPLEVFTSALFNGGYEASLTHARPGCVKTNAPFSYIWDLYRHWVKMHDKDSASMKDSPGKRILMKEPSQEVSFEYNQKSADIETLRQSKMVKFQENPRADWGPQSKAKKVKTE